MKVNPKQPNIYRAKGHYGMTKMPYDLYIQMMALRIQMNDDSIIIQCRIQNHISRRNRVPF